MGITCPRVVLVVLAGTGLRRAGVPRLGCRCGRRRGGRWLPGRCLGRASRAAWRGGFAGCGGRPVSAFPLSSGFRQMWFSF